MKKICGIVLSMLLLCGCGSENLNNVVNKFVKKVNNTDGYLVKGTMEIRNDEDTFKYNVETKYKSDDMYKVSLVNTTNGHEQVILKNDSGVYVITPSLNKSFKFQSEWPNNSSQAYLITSLVNDLKNDENYEVTKKDDYYVVKLNVNYPNNPDLKYQKIYFNSDKKPYKVEVFDKNDEKKIIVNFNKIDYSKSYSKKTFELDEIIDDDCCKTENKEEKSTSLGDDIIYPLYVPSETYLQSKDVVQTDDSNRVILTFAGDKSFILVEEEATVSEEFEIVPVYGDPLLLNDTYGALSANSLSWTKDNIEYYLSSTSLTDNEMLTIASSIGNESLVVNK